MVILLSGHTPAEAGWLDAFETVAAQVSPAW
jgi:hypothetical protein